MVAVVVLMVELTEVVVVITAGNSFAGGGYGGHYPNRMGTDGTEFTGGGGGATDNGQLDPGNCRGNGGSGIVLIAYIFLINN